MWLITPGSGTEGNGEKELVPGRTMGDESLLDVTLGGTPFPRGGVAQFAVARRPDLLESPSTGAGT